MKDFWPFVITGLTTGSLYSIAAMGLVLTYKTSGIFNFAHGAVACGSAYLFYEMHVQHGLPWPLAAAVCIFVAAPLVGVLLERLARLLASVPPAAKIVATVGLLLVIQGTATSVYGGAIITSQEFLPQRLYRMAGLNVGFEQIVAVAIAALAAIGLSAFFRYSRTGLAMRGVVDNTDLLDLAGTSPRRVRRQAWMIGNSFAALSGILIAPKLGLEPVLLTLLVVQAFGAAAVGRFSSLSLTYVGGLVLGVAGALSTKYVADYPTLAGLPAALPFLILFLVLLMSRKGRFVEAVRRPRPAADVRSFPVPAVWAGRTVLLLGLVLVPAVVQTTRLPVYTNGLILILVFVSLRLLVRTSGQVSLCHAAFAAIGAVTFSHLTTGAGLPWLVAFIGAGLVTVPVGAVVAIPAIRLSGLYLALATFGFGILLERMFFTTDLMFGFTGNRSAPRPELGGLNVETETGFYYVCLAVVVLASVAVFVLTRGRLGRLLSALAESPVALATHGAAVNVTRVLVFCISAFFAGLAGALFGAASGTVSGIGFSAFASLTWLAVLALAGRGEFSAPVLAAFLLVIVPSYVENPTYVELQPVFFGMAAVIAALLTGRQGAISEFFARRGAAAEHRVAHNPTQERWVDCQQLAEAGARSG